ncbi:MAG: DnaK suppressor protein [Paracoccaceae bacterium]|jgi:DnaK suppressor protein
MLFPSHWTARNLQPYPNIVFSARKSRSSFVNSHIMKRYAALLRRRLQDLEALDAQSAESRGPVELDQQSVGRLSRMDAMQAQAMAQETHRRRVLEMRRIGLALRRIEDDDFGWCGRCGEAIPEGRLEIDLAATLCVTCAR